MNISCYYLINTLRSLLDETCLPAYAIPQFLTSTKVVCLAIWVKVHPDKLTLLNSKRPDRLSISFHLPA